MGMANGYGLPFLVRIFGGDFELMADGGDFLDIIEERNVAKGAGHTGVLGRVERHGGSGGAAVDEEELVIAEHGHEFGHQVGVGSGQRALMIIYASGIRHGAQHGVQCI